MMDSNELLQRVNRVGASTDLVSIQLVKLRVEAQLRPEEVVGQTAKYFIEQRVSHNLGADGKFEVFVWYVVRLKSEDAAKEWLVISPTFRILYQVRVPDSLSAEDVQHFASLNGVFNSWPYLRELVQNTSERMGFPALTIHLYRLNLPATVPTKAG